MADLSRIWSARAAVSSAEQELNRAIDQAPPQRRRLVDHQGGAGAAATHALNTEHR